jgi:hypothetical protein
MMNTTSPEELGLAGSSGDRHIKDGIFKMDLYVHFRVCKFSPEGATSDSELAKCELEHHISLLSS